MKNAEVQKTNVINIPVEFISFGWIIKTIKRLLILFSFLVVTIPLNAQIVFEPLSRDVYSFLERLSDKGVIEIENVVKPLSRKYIAGKIIEAEGKSDMLNSLEKKELEFYRQDYYFEIDAFRDENKDKVSLSYFNKDAGGRYRAFSYSDKILKVNVDPLIGYQISFPGKLRNIHSWMGLSSYGYISDNIGFSMDFRSNSESGTYYDMLKRFTPETGVIARESGGEIDYSQVNSTASVDWDWGSFIVAKDFMEYGYAKSGNLVLSNKAPSFPYIQLRLNPVKWLNFYYFHAFLNSDVIDSAKLEEYKRDIYVNKYFAWHSLVVTPLKGLDISIGESVVYSNKLELVYLMPFLFYYYADDFLSNRHDKPGDANQQIFFSLSSRNHIKNTHLYATMFIDELTLRGIGGTLFVDGQTVSNAFSDTSSRTQLGYTVGMSTVDMPVNNLTFTIEYTRINPFVYGHHDPAQTYTSSSYILGHWIGQNADLIYAEFNYRFLRGLQATLYGEYVRKGSSDYSDQYGDHQPVFLFGLKNYYTYLGLDIKYELVHDLNFEAKLKMNIASNEQDDGSFEQNQLNEFSFSAYYGF